MLPPLYVHYVGPAARRAGRLVVTPERDGRILLELDGRLVAALLDPAAAEGPGSVLVELSPAIAALVGGYLVAAATIERAP
jgi:hypothetical protein